MRTCSGRDGLVPMSDGALAGLSNHVLPISLACSALIGFAMSTSGVNACAVSGHLVSEREGIPERPINENTDTRAEKNRPCVGEIMQREPRCLRSPARPARAQS